MPDHDRRAQFVHPMGQDFVPEIRCPVCPGFRVTYDSDCVYCGRELVHLQDSKVDSVKASLDTKLHATSVATMTQLSNQPVTQENLAPKSPEAANGRVKSCPTPVRRSVRSIQSRLNAGIGLQVGQVTLVLGKSRSSVKISQQSTQVASRSSSSRKRTCVAPGKTSALKVGPHHDFKGVRTREGVKGFLVEIRPPKWKRTIWLGTYDTDIEAAVAFDAGVFYTKKPDTKYNFHVVEGAFPPLPSHLRLDKTENMEEIKDFVQKQAKKAAAEARKMLDSCNQPRPQAGSVEVKVETKELVLATPALSSADTTANTNPSNEPSELSCLTDGSVSKNTPEGPPSTPEVQCEGEFEELPLDLEFLQGEPDSEEWISNLMLETGDLQQL